MQTLEEIADDLAKYDRPTLKRAILAALRAERAAERERCAKVAEKMAAAFASPEYADSRPISTDAERFACAAIARDIRNQP